MYFVILYNYSNSQLSLTASGWSTMDRYESVMYDC